MSRFTAVPGSDRPRGRYFGPLDLVEDNMRVRIVGIGALFLMWLFIGGEFGIISPDDDPPYVLTSQVTFASAMPSENKLGPILTTSGAPPVGINVLDTEGKAFYNRTCPALGDEICDDDDSAVEPVVVTASVSYIAYSSVPRNTLNCGTTPSAPRTMFAGSTPVRMIETACTPALLGDVNQTDETGSTTFPNLAIASGPAAIYGLTFDGGDGVSAQAQANVAARVGLIEVLKPDVGFNMRVTPGVPFSTQPQVRVLDDEDQPVPNATVIAFASEHLNFFQDWRKEEDKTSRSDGVALHHVRGQNYHLLEGAVSLPTGADGIATWDSLMVTASSSKYLYLMFFCEGAVASWNDPQMRPPVPGKPPRPPRYSSPIYVDSPVASIVMLDPLSNTSLEPGVCQPIGARITSVVEGELISTAMYGDPLMNIWEEHVAAPRVRMLDVNGAPVVGARAIAVLHTYANNQLPNLERPQLWRLNDPKFGSHVTPEAKHLINAVSEPSDADGVASFPNISFSTAGKEDGSNFGIHSKLAFCTAGATSTGVYDGCAISCPIKVLSRATFIDWSVQPSYLRTKRLTSSESIEPGEPFTVLPIAPVVRFVDDQGHGVPGKLPRVWVVDVDAIIATCASVGITVTESDVVGLNFFSTVENWAGGGECMLSTVISMDMAIKVDRAVREGETGMTGPSGFAEMPLSYSHAATSYFYLSSTPLRILFGSRQGDLITIPGDAVERALQGRIRLIASDEQYTTWSMPSDPVSFSVPSGLFTPAAASAAESAAAADDVAIALSAVDQALAYSAASSGDGICTKLDAVDIVTARVLIEASQRVPVLFQRRPDPFGGSLTSGTETFPLLGSGKSTTVSKIKSMDSWMIPLEKQIDIASTGSYDKESVSTYITNMHQIFGHPPMADASFADQPDFLDLEGDIASFLGRVRQAVLGDYQCNDPASADVLCDNAGAPGVCPDTKACLKAQWADSLVDSLAHSLGANSSAYPAPDYAAEFPVVNLRATDVAGNGVPGLRVTLNFFDVQYPHLAPVGSAVSCGLIDPNADVAAGLEIEGFTADEVAAMQSGNARTQNAPCYTDANGYVQMKISHPFEEGLNVPEYLEYGSTGTLKFEYAAYEGIAHPGCYDANGSPAICELRRACAFFSDMAVESQVASIDWGYNVDGAVSDPRMTDPEDQVRTAFNILESGGAIDEVPPNNLTISGEPSTFSFGSYTVWSTIDLASPEALADENSFGFKAMDTDKSGVDAKLVGFDFVHLPSYLPGWTTRLSPQCFTSDDLCDLRLGDAFVDLPESEGANAQLRIQEFGLSVDPVTFLRATTFPFAPFASCASIQTGTWSETVEPGVGAIRMYIHSGHPGVYGVVLTIDGIRSSPVIFNVKSKLSAIEIVTEPSNTVVPLAAAGRRLSEDSPPEVVWRVKSGLAQAPRVRLLDVERSPLSHYQVFARAVNATTLEPLSDVLLDLSDGVGTSLEGFMNPMGSARSSPADENGVSLFESLTLFDAKNGTRFKVEFFFSVTAPYEDEMLADYGVTAAPRVSVFSSVTCVAINNHRMTAVQQPSTSVVLGSPLPQTPSVFLEIELEPFEWTDPNTTQTYTLYKIPSAIIYGILSVQLLASEFSGAYVPEELQIKVANYAFSGSRCVVYQAMPFAGTCDMNAVYGNETGVQIIGAQGSGSWFGMGVAAGYIIGGVSVPEAAAEVYASYPNWMVDQPAANGVFAEATPGTKPTWVTTINFDGFKWQEGYPGATIRPSCALEFPGSIPSANFATMALETEPATIELLNSPPREVFVGESFVLLAKVTISSGMPLAGAFVETIVAPAVGVVISPAEFITDTFNIGLSSLGPDEPSLDPAMKSVVTNKNGIARFVLQFLAGSDGEQVTLQVQASNGVKSSRSTIVELHNALSGVSSNNVSVDITGVHGVGKKDLIRESAGAQGYTDFSIKVPLDDIVIDLTLDAWATPIPAGSPLKETLYFRVFTKSAIEAARKYDNVLSNLTGEVDAIANEAIDGTARTGEAIASGDVTATEATARLAEVVSALSASLRSSGAEMLRSFLLLLVSGSGPQLDQEASSNAAVLRGFAVEVTGPDPKSQLTVSGIEVNIARPGEYYLQPVIVGIPGDVIGPIDVEKYNGKTWQSILLDYLLKIFSTLVVATTAIGVSDWHDPKYGVPIGVAMILTLLILSCLQYELDDWNSVGLWYVITLSIMLVGTLVSVLGLMIGHKVKFLKPFSTNKKERMFAYCKRLVSRPPSESTKIMAQLRGNQDLPTRLYLQKRLEMEQRNERSDISQLKAIVRSLYKEDEAAFYFPARMYATLVVSLFANGFLLKQAVTGFASLADSVRAADVATIGAIRNQLTSLQAQFLRLADADLPAVGCDWANENVDRLHDYIVGLANAIDVASTVGCTLGMIIYLVSWTSMLLDFRGRCIQARRGIWSFNVSKVKLKHQFIYFGAQVSNGMITFVIFSFILFIVVLVLAWNLSWEVVKWILRNNLMLILGLVIPIVVNILIKLVVTKLIGPAYVIKRRFSWMFYDLFQLLLSCVTGIMKAVVRFVLVVAVTVFTLPRMDVSLMPAWLDYYIALDSGARAYHAVILSYNTHNHPVMRVFAWILQEKAAAIARGDVDATMTPAKLRTRNMLWKLWMMHKNPGIAQYSASGSLVDLKVIAKAAKKKDISILKKELEDASATTIQARARGKAARESDEKETSSTKKTRKTKGLPFTSKVTKMKSEKMVDVASDGNGEGKQEKSATTGIASRV